MHSSRDQQTPISNNDDVSDNESDDPYQRSNRPSHFMKGPKYNGPLYSNGPVSQGHQMKAENRKLPVQPQVCRFIVIHAVVRLY